MAATSFEAGPAGARPAGSRLVWVVGGALGLVSLTAAGTIAIRSALPEAAAAPARPAAADAVPALRAAGLPMPLAAATPKCADCGVVESVRSVTRKGQGIGSDAVAAGHETQKRARRHTVHELRVRMDDGTLRTIEQAQPEAQAGDRVVVQGNSLKPAPAPHG